MEVLRDCQSPIEMNSFDVEMNSTSSPEKQAMISRRANENSVHHNNNNTRSQGMFNIYLRLIQQFCFLQSLILIYWRYQVQSEVFLELNVERPS